MAKTFVAIHSSNNLQEESRRAREKTKSENMEALGRKSNIEDGQNIPFKIGELKRALDKAGQTAPGKDEICYCMMKHLSVEGLEKLLMLYNRVWIEGMIPGSWKEAIIIPIRKPGKDASRPGSYRPIALTSHICKIMERMVNERLTYYLEKREMVASYQSGFRKGRSTIDSVIRLEDEIRKAQINKETMAAVFFDVEKAYDMLWKEGLLIKLNIMGVGGRIFNWIMDFLNERTIQVKIGAELSSQYIVENGTPQGSVISPTLFSIMINDVFVNIPNDIGRSLFADDGALWKRGRNVEYVVKKMQDGINQVEKWGTKWGFKFSVEKTKVMFFTRKKVKEWYLKLYGNKLERVESFRFLGVYFDVRLTWREHIRYVVDKCKKVINVMRCLAGLGWGADVASLKYIYIALIRSRLDYGSIVYGSAAKSVLADLDVIQARALRVCVGAVRTSPVCALQVEAGEMPLWLRRKQLGANYWVSLKGHGDSHPAKKVMQACWEKETTKKTSFGWTGDQMAKDTGVYDKEFGANVVWPIRPVWELETPCVDLELLKIKRNNKNADLNTVYYSYKECKYKESIQIFTDGSKNMQTEATGSAVVIPKYKIEISKRTSDCLSVFAVEMFAILMALEWTEQISDKEILICSDSVSALVSMEKGTSRSHLNLLYEVLFMNSRINRQGKNVIFMWVPAHLGIQGNEKADKVAKEAIKKEDVEVNIKLSKSEGKGIVWRSVNQQWQQSWDNATKGRHLYEIQRKVGISRSRGANRKEQVIISRLRIGHSNLNSTLLIIGKHPTGMCEQCQEAETVEHVLKTCRTFNQERQEMITQLQNIGRVDNTVKSLLEYGESVEGRKWLFVFLKRTGLDKRI